MLYTYVCMYVYLKDGFVVVFLNVIEACTRLKRAAKFRKCNETASVYAFVVCVCAYVLCVCVHVCCSHVCRCPTELLSCIHTYIDIYIHADACLFVCCVRACVYVYDT